MKKLLVFISVICMFIGCTKSDEFFGDDSNMVGSEKIDLGNLIAAKSTIALEGFTRFAFYVPKERRYITDGYSSNFLECTAELIFTDKQNFILNTSEVVPGINLLYREISFVGKISPGGQLKFEWPDTWNELNLSTGSLEERDNILAQVKEHTGYNISGQGINENTLVYIGNLDQENFFAEMHILGLQEEPGSMEPFWTIVEGPVLVNFMIDLRVKDPE